MKRLLVLALLALAACKGPVKLGTNLPSGNGQTTSAKSVSVVVASDQTVPVSGTITSTAPDGGFATEGTLSAMNTKTPSKGTAVMTGSEPVTIATDDTLTAAIKADVDKIPSKGTAAMAGSTPVTLATDDTMASKLTQPTTTAAVTASDSTVLACGKGLWVGTAGDLSLKLSGDSSAVTWKNVPSGSFTPGNVIRVMAATTATNIVCLN